MPIKVCRRCGRITNTAVSDWVDSNDDKADGCYAAFVDGEWQKGCAYDEAEDFYKEFVDKLLNGKPE